MIQFYTSLRSVQDILTANRGEGPGFNFMRLALSLLILGAHSSWIAGASSTLQFDGPAGFFLLSLVPAFFALSGFLVTGSALRTNAVRPFIGLRLIRIVPALFVEVTLSALILGPIFTTYLLSDYFTDIRFFEYFGNIVGRIRFELPGVFETNPIDNTVNINLWTLKPEFYCYIVMSVMIGLNVINNRTLFLGGLVTTTVLATIAAYTVGFGVSAGNYHWTVVVFYFFAGCAYFQWREHVKIHWVLFLLALAISVTLMSLPRELAFLLPPFLTYCVIYIGMLPLRLPAICAKYDVSYGIYLYGFPIQQALVSEVPGVHGNGLLMFALAAPLTIAFALFSWIWIEKPFLKFKPYITGQKKRDPAVKAASETQPVAAE
ncbi:acyltransferase family protein [Pararhizobium sp.]|uniref:acyltransferase family protein n=1 Tax=Pararhizobium sp. TaxID=1977563 RepID=UPI0027174C2C|nr:acyltransferase [Pararhizobium sp.]MDO9418707.1 acyltransferase [Pararhizobium sp.]